MNSMNFRKHRHLGKEVRVQRLVSLSFAFSKSIFEDLALSLGDLESKEICSPSATQNRNSEYLVLFSLWDLEMDAPKFFAEMIVKQEAAREKGSK